MVLYEFWAGQDDLFWLYISVLWSIYSSDVDTQSPTFVYSMSGKDISDSNTKIMRYVYRRLAGPLE